MSIQISCVSKFYGKQKALNQVNFSLDKGEICGFLGPNGAGKSTLMKIMTGYLKEFEGDVYLDGLDIRKESLKARKLIGYLPEHNPLYPDMYVPEYLRYVARLYKTPQTAARVKEIMDLTGLTAEKRKKIGQLSKGYRQRVGLAQALVHNPDILILDEPMTGLDPNQLEEIRELIIRIGQDKTVILSTHVMQEVEAICNRIIILHKGNIVIDKSKKELHRWAQDGLWIEVKFATGEPEAWLKDLTDIQEIRRDGSTFHLLAKPECDPRISLFHAAAAHHCPIIELTTEEKNLQEIFRQLTTGQPI